MTAVGQKPDATYTQAMQLNQDVAQASDYDREGQGAQEGPRHPRRRREAPRARRAKRDEALQKAVSLAETGAPEGGKLQDGYMKLGSNDAHVFAGVAAEIARIRSLDSIRADA